MGNYWGIVIWGNKPVILSPLSIQFFGCKNMLESKHNTEKEARAHVEKLNNQPPIIAER